MVEVKYSCPQCSHETCRMMLERVVVNPSSWKPQKYGRGEAFFFVDTIRLESFDHVVKLSKLTAGKQDSHSSVMRFVPENFGPRSK